MIKFILSLSFSMLALCGVCGGQSALLLDRLNSSIKDLGAYSVNFNISVERISSMSGFYAVDGQKYFISFAGVDIFSDSKTKYEIQHHPKEVNIDNHSDEDNDILSNPSQIMDFFTKSYQSELVGDNVLKLIPKDASLGISYIEVSVNAGDFLPKRIVYKTTDSDENIIINIEKIDKLAPSEQQLFHYDKKAYKGYEIIDFR